MAWDDWGIRSMNGKLTLILAGLFLFGLFALFCMFLIDNMALWLRSWGGPHNPEITSEKAARANWWCPARRHRIATTGVAGFNMSIFPIKTQWRHALIRWLFPNYFWSTIGRHGMCLGSGCAVWRWHDKQRGWCGLAPRPNGEFA